MESFRGHERDESRSRTAPAPAGLALVSARGGIGRASAGVALSQYVARAVVLVRGVLAASALGPVGFGGWNALNLILDYGSYASAGAIQGLDLRLPASVAREDAVRARAEMAGAWGVTLLGAIAFAGIVVFVPSATMREIGAAFGRGAALLMLVAAVLQLAVLYLASSLRAHGRFGAVSRGQGLQAVIGGGLGIALLWRFGVWGLISGWIAGTLVAIGLMWRAVPEAPLVPAEPATGFGLARAGLPLFAFYALSLLLRSSDRLALVRFGAPAALGQYALGLMAAGLVLYGPEAVGFVLFPRVAAAAAGARDAESTRAELLRAHRTIAVLLPLPVLLAVLAAGPVVTSLLPAYAAGLPALRLLAVASLLFSASTLPGYFLLAAGYVRRLLVFGGLAVALDLVVVFAVAARDPRPESVAWAALAGYGAFALALVAAAAPVLFGSLAGRARFVATSFGPPLATGVLVLAACAWRGGVESWTAALARAAVVVPLAAAMLVAFARGFGLFVRRPVAVGS